METVATLPTRYRCFYVEQARRASRRRQVPLLPVRVGMSRIVSRIPTRGSVDRCDRSDRIVVREEHTESARGDVDQIAWLQAQLGVAVEVDLDVEFQRRFFGG